MCFLKFLALFGLLSVHPAPLLLAAVEGLFGDLDAPRPFFVEVS